MKLKQKWCSLKVNIADDSDDYLEEQEDKWVRYFSDPRFRIGYSRKL